MLSVRTGLLAVVLNLIQLSCHQSAELMPTITPTVVFPLPNQIFQRDADNRALVPIDVRTDATASGDVYAEFTPIGTGSKVGPVKVGAFTNGKVQGAVSLTGGDYKLNLTIKGGSSGSAVIDRVGVGEVLVVFGHSVAQGETNQVYNNPDPRVRCVNYHDPECTEANLPLVYSPVTATSKLGPFGSGPYAWAVMGTKLAAALNVPVLLFNTAFGGSQILQTYKVIKGIPFDHSFIKYNLGMPYQPLRATLTKYIPTTGIRAVLVHHGVNDRNDSNRQQFAEQYRTVIQHSRDTYKIPDVAWLLAMEDGGIEIDSEQMRAGTSDVLASEPNCYVGADLLALRQQRAGRDDTIHLRVDDWDAYATLWANSLLAVINKTKPKSAVLATEYTSNMVSTSVLGISNARVFLPNSEIAFLAVAVGITAALFLSRKLIPALIALCFVTYGLGRLRSTP
jgi:hypothetical protein